jgi:hypothetical protein
VWLIAKNVAAGPAAFLFSCPEDEGGRFLSIVDTHLLDYTVSPSRKL